MRLQPYHWIYLAVVGRLCAPVLFLSGSLEQLQNRSTQRNVHEATFEQGRNRSHKKQRASDSRGAREVGA